MTSEPKESDLHVALIMDGNGRWAQLRDLPREVGHERGVEALRRTVDAARDLPIKTLTVFSFSTENWKRPMNEVSSLFGLLRLYVQRDLNRLHAEGVQIKVLGRRSGLPEDILKLIHRAEEKTAENNQFYLNIAFNYGARDEIVRAVQELSRRTVAGELLPEDIGENEIEAELFTAGQKAPDLLVRTSGEHRLSNFLLWQLAYTELYFTDKLWPDFDGDDLAEAIENYTQRQRRFGGVVTKAVTT